MRNLYCILFLFAVTMAYPIKMEAQQTIPYGDNPIAGKHIVLNGVNHYYEVYGTGAPLLLIHGNSTGIKGWAAQIEYFSKKYTVYANDCRGRGKSDLGKDTLSYIQQAKDMTAFISQLKLDAVSIIGKSDGAIVAIMMGIYYPEHLSKIVAFSANMVPDTTALYPETVADAHNERINADKKLAAKDTTQNWYLIQQRNRMMEFQPQITAEDLHRITVPTLVLSTDRDVIKEEHTLFIYRNISNAHLAFIAGETHHVPRKNPALFNSTVEKFLQEPQRSQSYRFTK
jgi:pimeloyl-ACP methyl ester carboxylesterase